MTLIISTHLYKNNKRELTYKNIKADYNKQSKTLTYKEKDIEVKLNFGKSFEYIRESNEYTLNIKKNNSTLFVKEFNKHLDMETSNFSMFVSPEKIAFEYMLNNDNDLNRVEIEIKEE